MTVKEGVILAIQRFPEDIDFKDVSEEAAFLTAIHQAAEGIAAGRVIGNEEMGRRIREWTAV